MVKKRLSPSSFPKPMSQANVTYTDNGKSVDISIQKGVSPELIDEVVEAIRSVKGWGSIEIYVQDYCVTQITVRKIKKTKHVLAE
jgi:hypothetical protein